MATPSVSSAMATKAPPRPMRRVLPTIGPRAASTVCDCAVVPGPVCAQAGKAIVHAPAKLATPAHQSPHLFERIANTRHAVQSPCPEVQRSETQPGVALAASGFVLLALKCCLAGLRAGSRGLYGLPAAAPVASSVPHTLKCPSIKRIVLRRLCGTQQSPWRFRCWGS